MTSHDMTGQSHGADAFRVMATRFRYIEPPPPPKPNPTGEAIVLTANPDGSVSTNPGSRSLSGRKRSGANGRPPPSCRGTFP